MSISGYRRLLKSASLLFNKDKYALTNAKIELKAEFLKNKGVVDPVDLSALLRGIEEVDEMLRFNVVQGALNEKGNYGKSSILYSDIGGPDPIMQDIHSFNLALNFQVLDLLQNIVLLSKLVKVTLMDHQNYQFLTQASPENR